MSRAHHHHPYAKGGGGWSIGSNGLTAAGRSELLKDLGRQLQMGYQSVLREPAPDRIRHLLERLENSRIKKADELS